MQEVIKFSGTKRKLRISARPINSTEYMGMFSGVVVLNMLGAAGGPKGWVSMTPDETLALCDKLREAALEARQTVITQDNLDEVRRALGRAL